MLVKKGFFLGLGGQITTPPPFNGVGLGENLGGGGGGGGLQGPGKFPNGVHRRRSRPWQQTCVKWLARFETHLGQQNTPPPPFPKPLWKGSKHRAGGIGIYSQEDAQSGTVSILEPLLPGLRQTNNAAELGGGVQLLKRLPGDIFAILSDSEYLICGAQGQVHLWNEMA